MSTVAQSSFATWSIMGKNTLCEGVFGLDGVSLELVGLRGGQAVPLPPFASASASTPQIRTPTSAAPHQAFRAYHRVWAAQCHWQAKPAVAAPPSTGAKTGRPHLTKPTQENQMSTLPEYCKHHIKHTTNIKQE
jgi:hypothetical protein